ncbi:MAG: hypothetical protein ACR2RL_20895, partial [Gammaproteobacteria bacterium]
MLARANVQFVHDDPGPAGEPDNVRIFRRCLGPGPDGSGDLPVAVLTRLGESPDSDESLDARCHWLRADPVHLRPDLAGLSMLPTEALDLEIEEARALVDALNAHFAGEAFEFEAPSARRWYVRSGAPFDLVTTPPGEALERELNRSLPGGPGAARWHGIMNEIQMVLHGATVNAERSGRRQLAVNSVWLWGEGTLSVAPHRPFANVWSDDPLVRGLARASGAHAGPLPERFDAGAVCDAAAEGL